MLHALWCLITLPIAILSFAARMLLWPAVLLLALVWLAGRLVRR